MEQLSESRSESGRGIAFFCSGPSAAEFFEGGGKAMLDALYLEIDAIGIILMLTILYSQRQMQAASAVQRQFNGMIGVTIFMLVIDAACWMLDGTTFPMARVLNYTVESIYYALHVTMPFFWAIYVELALSADMKAARRRLFIAGIPLVLLIAFLPFNIRLGWVFSIDAKNVYHREWGLIAYAVYTYAALLYASTRALIKAKESIWVEDRRRCYTMAFFAVLPSLGGILQAIFYGVSLNWILAAVSVLFVYIDAQNRQISADPLTGLNNRRELSKFLLKECQTQREGTLALIMIDVDGFKQVNDTFGHFYGDTVLQRVANILKLSCKNTQAFIGRYGGDEFCIVYPASDPQAITDLIDLIDDNLRIWNEVHPDVQPIQLSLGYSIYQTDQDDCAETLIHRADRQMYQIKNEKKGL